MKLTKTLAATAVVMTLGATSPALACKFDLTVYNKTSDEIRVSDICVQKQNTKRCIGMITWSATLSAFPKEGQILPLDWATYDVDPARKKSVTVQAGVRIENVDKGYYKTIYSGYSRCDTDKSVNYQG